MKVKQWLIEFILNVFGYLYIKIEKHMRYDKDQIILGVPIDPDLQKMSRKRMCRYMDVVLPKKGFYELQSTTKIRLGCQLLRNYVKMKGGNSWK
tara:strand:- start:50 stop:331 length:282 start_codon:yes stop_codon:yes gene_type:complete